MDPTLLGILLLFVIATVVGVLQARRRDKCLRHVDGYRVTIGEADGDLAWGDLSVFSTGLELAYVEPVDTEQGHLERSYLIYKDQYAGLHAIYRYPLGLSAEQRERRAEDLRRTMRPSLFQRIGRTLRNWLSMIRDSVLQALSLVIGMAKTRAPGATVLSKQEEGIKSLSNEIIGYTGNAYDPLLERHLNQRVVVEVTREGRKRSYCGWLKDYSATFIELLDAVVVDRDGVEVAPFKPGEEPVRGVEIRAGGRSVEVRNDSAPMLFVREIVWKTGRRPLDTVVPAGFAADVTLPPEVDVSEVDVWIGTAQRIDMVLPRAHALVRHAALLLPKAERPEQLTDAEAVHTVESVAPGADPAAAPAGERREIERQKESAPSVLPDAR